MTERLLMTRLKAIAGRHRRYRRDRALALCWLLGAAALIAALLAYRLADWWSTPLVLLIGAVTIAAAALAAAHVRRSEPNVAEVAKIIERQYPELNALLRTAVEQQPDAATGELNYFQQRVVDQAMALCEQQGWRQSISDGQLRTAASRQLAMFCLLAGAATMTWWYAPVSTNTDRHFGPHRAATRIPMQVTVSPGDAEIERGLGMVIEARFEGTPAIPNEVHLLVGPDEANLQRIRLTRHLDDPLFGTSIRQVNTDLIYRIEYGKQQTENYKLTVYDHPDLERADAEIQYPAYTRLPAKTVEDTRRLSAVEGSTLRLSLTLNKPVRNAQLIGDDGQPVALTADPADPKRYLTTMPMTESRRYVLQLVDEADRRNKVPAQFVFEVSPNREPAIKLAFPRKDVQVSPIEELEVEATATDDFGLLGWGVSYTIAGQPPKEIDYAKQGDAAPPAQASIRDLIMLEDLGAKADQLLSYHFWAEDVGPDGQVRRTHSDMYFAEVRPLEEIFREAEGQDAQQQQQQQQQQGQNAAQQAEQMALEQKQIIIATWNVMRANNRAAVSAGFADDVTAVRDGQLQVIEKTAAMKEQVSDERAGQMVDEAIGHMQQAAERLEAAAKDGAVGPLTAALAAEQAAYQALLALRAREHEVMMAQQRQQQQQQSSQSTQSSRAQRQLEQLEMRRQDERYETESQAGAQQQQQQRDAAQREQLQTLNRLRELARRQGDINEKLRELELALQEARTEQEQQEIRRQLKRLREEQQEILRDVDELRQRMNQQENQAQNQPQRQQQLQEARQQLDETRQQVRNASEALQQENVSQAAASGARAERQLNDLRDELRSQTAGQFDEQMRQMREDARELAEQQQQIGQQLQQREQAEHRSLTDAGENQKLAEQLREQRGDLNRLLEEMKRVTEQSEQAEPLLARRLYDTIREASQQKVDEALDLSSRLAERNYLPDAAEVERHARQGIEQLRQGVEQAAEGVLGDEMESLRLAQRELRQLADQVNREIAQGDPSAAAPRRTESEPGDRQNDAARRPGEEQGQEPQPTGQQGDAERRGDPPGREGEAQANRQPRGEQQGERVGEGERPDAPQSEEQPRGQGRQPGDQPREGGQGGNAQPQGDRPPTPRPQGERGEQQPQPGERPESDTPQPRSDQPSQPGGQRPGGATDRQPGEGEPGEQPQEGRTPRPGERGQPAAPRPTFLTDGATGGGTGPHGPITGEDYRDWSDRLRNLEELLDDPALRDEIAQVRDRAREMRTEFKRHSKEPQWDAVRQMVYEPLTRLEQQVSEQLARRESKDQLAPIDRDPVPRRFSDLVRRYYEKLGSGD